MSAPSLARARWRAVVGWAGCGLALFLAGHVVRAQEAPVAVSRLDHAGLAGEWFEISTTPTWWHRRCVSNTRYRFDQADSGGLRATSVCTTPQGVEAHRGRLRAARTGDGRLSIRFAPAIFAWLPATWSDFWVLACGDDAAWILVGDNKRERLSILSRTVALDEAAMARAVAAARRQGYGVERLTLVPHPAGPTGLSAPR